MALHDHELATLCNDIVQRKRSGVTLQYNHGSFNLFSPSQGFAYSKIQGKQQIKPQEFKKDSLFQMDLDDNCLIGIWLNEQDNTVSMTFSNYTEDESEAQQYCTKTQQIGYYSFSQGKTVYL